MYNDKKIPLKKTERSVSYGSPSNFKEALGIHKSLSRFTKIAGVEVPIIHKFGKHNLDEMPSYNLENPHIQDLFKNISALQKLKMKAGLQAMGSENMKLIMQKSGFYTEKIIVEKYKEVYIPGIGNDAIHKLNQKGYDRHQIGVKLGANYLQEVHIHHADPVLCPVNLLLNEGGDEIWALVTEENAIDYFTNALADIGTGTSVTAPAATDTELLGTPVYVGMEASFPASATTRRVDFKGSFGDGVAQQAWEEFSVRNSNVTPKNLIRATASKGTKAAGETWTLEIQITAS